MIFQKLRPGFFFYRKKYFWLHFSPGRKKHERIQNFHILWKMYRENWPLEANFRQKRICEKNVRLQFGQNQKFLIYKLFRLIFVTSCIEGIFDFSKIEARFFFYRKKYFRLHFSPGRTKHAIFWEPLASCCCFKAKMKAKWSRLLKNDQRDSFGFVCYDFGGIFAKKMHFLTRIGKNCHGL